MEKLKKSLIDKEVTKVKTAEGYITLRGLFVPFFIEQILANLMGTINTLILGRFSDDAVAAVGAANQVLGFIFTFYAVICGGASVIISNRLGEGNEKEAKDVAFVSVIFTFVLSLGVSLILALFGSDIMGFLNLEGDTLKMSIDYFRIVALASVLQGVISAISAVLRSYGLSKPAVFASLLMNALNALFGYIVVIRPFETPLYGVTGVAFANTLARAIALIVIAVQLQKSKAAISVKGKRLSDFKCLSNILKIGIPGGVSNLSYSFSQIVSTSILALVGTMAISAKIYISSIVFYVYVVGYSLGMSSSILMGWMTGAKEFDKAERLNKMLLKFTIILNPSLSALIFIFHKPLLSLFTKNPEIIAMGASVFFIDIFVEFGRAFNHIEDYSLRGTGDVLVPMIVNMSSCWFMSILFSYILGVRLNMGLNGCWIAFMMDECFRGIVLLIRFKSGKWKQKSV